MCFGTQSFFFGDYDYNFEMHMAVDIIVDMLVYDMQV